MIVLSGVPSSLNAVLKLASDFAGLFKVCGIYVAVKWVVLVLINFPHVLKSGDLQAADRAMGPGPFVVRRGGSRAILTGIQIFSGLREIWVRDVYLRDDFLSIPRNALVVDLGANRGIFSTLALAQHESVTVIAVEPSVDLLESLNKCVSANGWSERITCVRGFIGTFTDTQRTALSEASDYSGAPTIAEADFISQNSLSKIDFLKCDIEGSEFFMLDPDSQLLGMSDRLAIELHNWGGDIDIFLGHLTRIGFEIGHIEWAHDSCIALCRRNTLGLK